MQIRHSGKRGKVNMERSGGAALVASPQPSTASPCSPALTRETRLNPLVTRETRSLPHDQRRDMGDNILFTDRLFLASWYTPFLHTTGMICTLENEGSGFFIAADRQILRVSSSDLTTVAFTCSDSVLRMLYVPPSKLLVIMTADKHLVVIQIQEDGSLSLSSKIVCAKRPVSMDFYSFGDSKMALLYADKIGELWATDLPSMKKRLCLGGHSASVVTDLVVSPCNRYVASCDRDEKIKIWSLPSFAIHSYCLAHTSVVTSLCFVTLQNVRSSSFSSSSASSSSSSSEKYYLCSVSWDGSLCLWDHISGALIDRILLVTPVPSAPATVINGDSSVLPAEELQKYDDDKGEEAENDNEEPDRVYDESKAGNFPFKIVAMHGRSEKEKADVDEGICYVAIAVRGERALRFVPITTISSSASAGEEGIIHTSTNTTENKREGVRFGAITSFSLPEIPFDLAVLPSSSSSSAFGDKLLVLLPAPFYLLALQVHAEGRAMPVATSGPLASAVHSFAAYCVKEGVHIAPLGASLSMDVVTGELSAMQKHALDNPYHDSKNSKKVRRGRPAAPEIESI